MWATGILGNATRSSFLNALTHTGVVRPDKGATRCNPHAPNGPEDTESHQDFLGGFPPKQWLKLLIVFGKESDTIRPEMIQGCRPQSPLSASAVKFPDQRSLPHEPSKGWAPAPASDNGMQYIYNHINSELGETGIRSWLYNAAPPAFNPSQRRLKPGMWQASKGFMPWNCQASPALQE